MLYALNLGSVKTTDNDKRILSATFDEFGAEGQPRVEELPQGDISNYLYVDGEYVLDELPTPEPPQEPIDMNRLEAQVTWTALQTDTLIEEV